ncbi:MAG: CBS domain-containing protein [Fibrobacter sp.]|jgi:Zn-dependent protease/predicted transcriptional regulator|nr:CBS domain-containing protein [Fibrobacter sp.]
MFGTRFTLFKLLGFEVRIDTSWIIIALLIVWSLAQGVFPLYDRTLSPSTYWVLGVLGAIGLFGSIIFHELCHSLVARRFGLPMKGITLFIFGGVAEMDDEPASPRAEFLMAIAGPLASIGVGALCFALLSFTRGILARPPSLVLSYLGTINLILAGFNLLPAFPLDGGRVFRSVLWRWKGNLRWATKVASGVGSAFGLFLIFLGVFSVLGGGLIGGIWWALIGLFLRSASKMSYQNVLVRDALEGESVRRFMKEEPVTVAADTTVDHLVEDFIYKYHYKMFPVVKDSKPLSCVNINDVRNIPREEWNHHTVDELAKPCSTDNTISIDEDALKALSLMNRTGSSRLMVVDHGGRLVGMVAMRDLMRFLALKLDLEEESVSKDNRNE